MNIKIIHWNIHSYNSNKDTLINLLRDYKPDIVCLNETWLKKEQIVNVVGYNVIRNDRQDGHGGVPIVIHKSQPGNVININIGHPSDRFQYIALELKDYCIINIYVPPDLEINAAALHRVTSRIVNTYSKPIIILGDFNGQNLSWGSGFNNIKGEQVLEFLDLSGMVILNNGEEIRVTSPLIRKSVPDLIICSAELSTKAKFEVIQDCGTNDHLPIMCIVSKNQYEIRQTHRSKYRSTFNVNKADWEKYKKSIKNMVTNRTLQTYEELADTITKAAEISISKKKMFKMSKPRHAWWDEECSQSIKQKKIALRRYNEHKSMANFISLKQVIARTKKLLKGKKSEGWKKFCEKNID